MLKKTGIFSNHNGMKIAITNRRKTGKSPDTVKINQWAPKEGKAKNT